MIQYKNKLHLQITSLRKAGCIVNNLQVRDTNKKKIVNFLYTNNGATKQKIAKTLGLSMPTVSLILKELSARGLVKKSGTLKSSGGRKPVVNSLAYDAYFSVGIEITQNHLRFVLINLGEDILHYKIIREHFQNNDAYYKKLADYLETFLAGSGIDRSLLLGIGIALPGLFNTKKNLLEYSPTLQVRNLPLGAITKYISYPVLANNEANLAGFAEIWHMDEVESAVFLSINKGVGGSIIVGNKVFNGMNGRAGEFGHMTIVKDGLTCSCGKKGCLEAYCSTQVLTEPNFTDVDEFFASLQMGNQYCMQKWETYLDYLATGINNLRTVFDSDIILGGEIVQYLKQYSDLLRKKLLPLNSFGEPLNYLHFSRYSDKASAIGAALLLVDAFLSDDTIRPP
ncbi:MAG TPA: sugar kinase, partial [Ruminococcaceae bacterium]|nr:sugar kinase [Oscillospiraceae bacterium]